MRRLLRQGAVSVDGVRVADPAAVIEVGEVVLKSGARTWHRVRP
ncbi:MAG TPA: S4 domain-containing protein [Kribbella sp.]|nr:S4 domain-containing protein [Kribbella sp.]